MPKFNIRCEGVTAYRIAEGKDLTDAFGNLGYTNFTVNKNVITLHATQRGHERKYYNEPIK